MNDPLSVAATVLPQSTFDPVEFSNRYRSDFFKKQEESGKRFADLASQFEVPGEWNPGIRTSLLEERNKIIDEGASQMAQGYDVTDITNPKSSQKARDYQARWQKLLADSNKSKAIENVLMTAKKTLLDDRLKKGDEGVFDADASAKRMAEVAGAKNLKEASDILGKYGDNVLVPRQETVNIGEYVNKQLPNYITPLDVETTKKIGGNMVTDKTKEIPVEVMKSIMSKMYNGDPKLQRSILSQMQKDPLTIPNETPLNYLFRNYGSDKLKQQYYHGTKPIEPKETKPVEKDYSVQQNPVKTTISIKGNDYTVTGTNVIAFNQKKTFNVSPGPQSLFLSTGKPAGIKGSVDFTPTNTAEYYITTKKTKGKGTKGGKPINVDWPAGTILPDGDYSKNPNVVKKRFVEGTYESGTGTTKSINTLLVPYDNISNELDANYKMGDEINKQKENTDPLGIL
jgi:hypothetical protein